jgi:hypothetical protein
MTMKELIDLVRAATDEEAAQLREALGAVGNEDVLGDDDVRNIAEDVVERDGMTESDVEEIARRVCAENEE